MGSVFDNGVNIHRRLVATEKLDSVYRHLLELIPNAETLGGPADFMKYLKLLLAQYTAI